MQETLYTGQWSLSPLQSRHLGTSYSSPNCHQLPCRNFLNLINGLKSLPFSKVILVLGKARSHRVSNLGCRGVESPGWFDVLPKNFAWEMMHELAHCSDEATNHQLSIDAAFWIIQIVSIEECSSFMQNLMQICWPTYSVILNVMATQYTCSLNGTYCLHWLVQRSCHCSHVCIPVHSPWLPGYIDVRQNVVILTMAGLFPDRPHHILENKHP